MMIKFLFLIFMIFITTPVRAADPALPPALQTLAAEGAQMKYLGRDLGFDGWIAVKDGQEQYFYVTPDGNAFVLGVLFNKNGRAVTFDQMRRLQGVKDPIMDDLLNAPSQKANLAPPAGLKPDAASSTGPTTQAVGPRASKGEQFFAAIQAASHFPLGAPSAPEIYVFVDPLCPHCHDLLNLLQPAIAAGRLRVQVVMVGALRPESGPLATAILAAPNPAEALRDHLKGAFKDGMTPVDPRLATHLKILTDWGFDATPVTVYRAHNGQIKILPGLPKSVTIILNDLR